MRPSARSTTTSSAADTPSSILGFDDRHRIGNVGYVGGAFRYEPEQSTALVLATEIKSMKPRLAGSEQGQPASGATVTIDHISSADEAATQNYSHNGREK